MNSPLLLNPILSDSFFLTLVLSHYAILLKCDERENCGQESNRESSQVNRKWKENLRGKIKTEMSPSGKIEKMEFRNQKAMVKS